MTAELVGLGLTSYPVEGWIYTLRIRVGTEVMEYSNGPYPTRVKAWRSGRTKAGEMGAHKDRINHLFGPI